MGQEQGKWLSVGVSVGAEFAAEADLRAAGFEVFLPWGRVKRKRSWRGLTIVTAATAAHFPGYMFVFVDEQHSVFRLRKVKGVIQVANRGGAVLPVASKVMEKMRAACWSDGYWLPEPAEEKPVPGPRVGDVVMIAEGPFLGFPGEVQEVDFRTNTMVLSVSIFGRPTNVSCSLSTAEGKEPELVG